MVANVTVSITGGHEAQNTTAVTLGAVWWGRNGEADFGAPLPVLTGLQTLTVFKTSAPQQISISMVMRDVDTRLNIVVQGDAIAINEI